jgi:hypothetical protein
LRPRARGQSSTHDGIRRHLRSKRRVTLVTRSRMVHMDHQRRTERQRRSRFRVSQHIAYLSYGHVHMGPADPERVVSPRRADPRLLAIPTSCARVAELNSNLPLVGGFLLVTLSVPIVKGFVARLSWIIKFNIQLF